MGWSAVCRSPQIYKIYIKSEGLLIVCRSPQQAPPKKKKKKKILESHINTEMNNGAKSSHNKHQNTCMHRQNGTQTPLHISFMTLDMLCHPNETQPWWSMGLSWLRALWNVMRKQHERISSSASAYVQIQQTTATDTPAFGDPQTSPLF